MSNIVHTPTTNNPEEYLDNTAGHCMKAYKTSLWVLEEILGWSHNKMNATTILSRNEKAKIEAHFAAKRISKVAAKVAVPMEAKTALSFMRYLGTIQQGGISIEEFLLNIMMANTPEVVGFAFDTAMKGVKSAPKFMPDTVVGDTHIVSYNPYRMCPYEVYISSPSNTFYATEDELQDRLEKVAESAG